MPEQQITFSVADKGGLVDPDAFLAAVQSVLETLRSVDSNMWQVHQPRFRWGIAEAKKSSPLTVTMRAEMAIEDATFADVVHWVMRGWRELSDHPKKPPRYFAEDDLKRAKVLGDLKASLKISAPGETDLTTTHRISTNVETLLNHKSAAAHVEYGSIEGVLRQVTVDPREDHRTSQFQIIDRDTGRYVSCRFNPAEAVYVGSHITSRIVVFGEIKYSAAREPLHIDANKYRIIDESKLPRLEDIQKRKLKIEDGSDPADYVRKLRGEDVE